VTAAPGTRAPSASTTTPLNVPWPWADKRVDAAATVITTVSTQKNRFTKSSPPVGLLFGRRPGH
jgi:hypothetical protein